MSSSSMTEIAHHEAEMGDVRLHYVTAGAGEPVVLLHGWPHTWFEWREVIPLLAERYFVVAPDLRGLGDSSSPPTGYDKRSIAHDVWRLLHDVLGEDHCFLVGRSWGSSVAYALATAHPDSVHRLVMSGATPPRAGNEYKHWHQLFAQVPELPEVLISGREESFFGWFIRKLAHPSFEVPDDVMAEYMRTYSQPPKVRSALEYYRALPLDTAHNTALASTVKLAMPVLCIQAGGPFNGFSSSTDVKLVDNFVEQQMAPLGSDIRGVIIEDVGYSIAEEKPQLFADTLLAFFASVE